MKNAAALALLLFLAASAPAASRIITDCPSIVTGSNTTVNAKFYSDSAPACGLACNATTGASTVQCALQSCTGAGAFTSVFTVNTTAAGGYALVFYNGSTNASCSLTRVSTTRPSFPDIPLPAVAATALAALLLARRKQRY